MQKKTIIIIVVAVVAVFFFIAAAIVGVGFFVARRVQKQAGITDMHIDKQGGKVEFKGGQMEFGKAAEWPTDMPSAVPKFTYGKIKIVTKSEVQNKKGWTVIFEEITTADSGEKYKEELKNSGWAIHATTKVSGQGESIMADKDKLQLFLFIDADKHTASLSLNEKD